jgi:hypothetical protein
MEVIEVVEDKFWLHEGGSVPPGAEDYDGPPPIPLDEVGRDLPAGWTAERAWYFSVGDDGQVNVVPTTIVESPNGERLQFFPRMPPRLAETVRGGPESGKSSDAPGGDA